MVEGGWDGDTCSTKREAKEINLRARYDTGALETVSGARDPLRRQKPSYHIYHYKSIVSIELWAYHLQHFVLFEILIT